mgnify:CR=1 FL=1
MGVESPAPTVLFPSSERACAARTAVAGCTGLRQRTTPHALPALRTPSPTIGDGQFRLIGKRRDIITNSRRGIQRTLAIVAFVEAAR